MCSGKSSCKRIILLQKFGIVFRNHIIFARILISKYGGVNEASVISFEWVNFPYCNKIFPLLQNIPSACVILQTRFLQILASRHGDSIEEHQRVFHQLRIVAIFMMNSFSDFPLPLVLCVMQYRWYICPQALRLHNWGWLTGYMCGKKCRDASGDVSEHGLSARENMR